MAFIRTRTGTCLFPGRGRPARSNVDFRNVSGRFRTPSHWSRGFVCRLVPSRLRGRHSASALRVRHLCQRSGRLIKCDARCRMWDADERPGERSSVLEFASSLALWCAHYLLVTYPFFVRAKAVEGHRTPRRWRVRQSSSPFVARVSVHLWLNFLQISDLTPRPKPVLQTPNGGWPRFRI